MKSNKKRSEKVNEWVKAEIRRKQDERMFSFIDPLPDDPIKNEDIDKLDDWDESQKIERDALEEKLKRHEKDGENLIDDDSTV